MKNSLLTLCMLGLAWPAQAQAQAPTAGPWTEVNLISPGTPATRSVVKTQTFAPTVAWAMTNDGVLLAPGNTAGTAFTARVTSGTAGYITVDFSAVSATTAFCARESNNGTGGEVVRTTDGGATWTKVTTSAQFGPDGFIDGVEFFDANVGVAYGDPLPPASGTGVGQFEFHRTTNGSVAAPTWTRIASPAFTQATEDEYGVVRYGTRLGNTVWIPTYGASSNFPNATNRVLRSTDQGLTWAGYATPLKGFMKVAFKDQNNGIACVLNGNLAGSTAPALARTTDGGATWTVVPLPTGRDTLRGKFYNFNISAIPGRGYVSVGRAILNDQHATNRGASFSADGISWYDLEKGGNLYYSADFIACTSSTDPRAFQGYLGGVTKAAASPTPGAGGVFQVSPTACALVPLATAQARSAALRGLTAAPNPSATGVFEVALATGLSSAAQVTVCDALGRLVASRALPAATTGGTTHFTLNLGHAPAGLYILRLMSNGETATSRLSIE
ncbi:photosystem II stability/assembly factor-like uncharacterized protein [Hymenobacter sp. UYAg731]